MFTVNVPNVLTLLRILLVPVLVVALLDKTSDGDVFAAIVFALASLTDAIDGYIARSRNAITTFGKLMDPVADKLLIVAALFSLVSLDRLPAWIAMVIVAREFAVTMTRMAAAPTGGRLPVGFNSDYALTKIWADPAGATPWVAADADAAAGAGATVSRTPLYWRNVQTAKGSWNWSAYDRIIGAYSGRGMRVIVN